VGSGLGELMERVLDAVRVEHQVGASLQAVKPSMIKQLSSGHHPGPAGTTDPLPGGAPAEVAFARFVAAQLARHETVSAVEVIGGGRYERTDSR
jgi:hypothetical protein